MLVIGSFSQGFGTFGRFTVEKYVAAYTDPAFAGILGNTAIFTLGSALVATALALFLAYVNTRTNIPFKFLFGIISIIPMMIPHILFAVSWVLLLNPSNGILNRWLMDLFGLSKALFNIYSLPGMILVEGLLDLPIAYLIIAPAMSAFDVALEESSKVCGASNLRTLTRVTLPVLRPAILASAILVIVRSLASFAVPSVIGIPGRIYVLSTHIYRVISTGFAADYGKAAAIGMSALAASITADLPLPLPDRGERPLRHHLQPRVQTHPDRPETAQIPPVRRRRAAFLRADRAAGAGALLHLHGPLRHGAECQSLFADELEELERGAQGSRSPCCP